MGTPLHILLPILLAAPLLGAARVLPPAAERAQLPSDLTSALAALRSSDGLEREAGERWLDAHLAPGHLDALAREIRVGDAEVRGRIARVLGSGDPRFGLAVRLLGEEEGPLREVGRRALLRFVLRFYVGASEKGTVGTELAREMRDLVMRPRTLEVDPEVPLARLFELLDRSREVPLGLALDPGYPGDAGEGESARFAPGLDRGIDPGRWNEVLDQVARRHGLSIEGHFFDDGRGGVAGRRGFLRFAPTGEVGRVPLAELLERWCRLLDRGTDPELRASAARALAASQLPAALQWMEERWVSTGEEVWLEGLLAGARAGRVAPVLTRPEAVRSLVARAEGLLGSGEARTRREGFRLLEGLEALGCLGPAGEDLVPVVASGWEEAGPAGRWLRLAVLAEQGCAGARAKLPLELSAGILQAPAGTHPPGLLVQALRVRAGLHEGALPEEAARDPEGLLRWVRDADRRSELVHLVESGGLLPPAELATPPRSADRGPNDLRESEGRLFVILWWLGAGKRREAVAHALAFLGEEPTLERGDAFARALSTWARMGRLKELRELLQEARTATTDPDVEQALVRVGVLSGAAGEGVSAVFLERALSPPARSGAGQAHGSGPDLTLLGALGGFVGGVGPAARDALLVLLRPSLEAGQDPPEKLREALEKVVHGLFSAGHDPEAEQFLFDLRAALPAGEGGEWVQAVRQRLWPLPPRAELTWLRVAERRLEL